MGFTRGILESYLVQSYFPDRVVKSCFPFLWNAERNHGSITAAILRDKDTSLPIEDLAHSPDAVSFIKEVKKSALYSFKDGMETLSYALFNHLDNHPNVDIHLNTTCTGISLDNNTQSVCLILTR
jgi:protoporphyrinogen oxidase